MAIHWLRKVNSRLLSCFVITLCTYWKHRQTANQNPAMSDDSSSEDDDTVQIRVSLINKGPKEYDVNSDPIAVPITVTKRGINAILQHLLETDDVNFNVLVQIPPIRLLRGSIESHLRKIQYTNTETVIPLHYFVGPPAPSLDREENTPDWVGSLSCCNDRVYAGCYDGSLQISSRALEKQASVSLHTGAIKCLATTMRNDKVWIATGTLNHTLTISQHAVDDAVVQEYAHCVEGHYAAVTSLAIRGDQLVSGDFDGKVCIWNLVSDKDEQPAAKKTKGSTTTKRLTPTVSFSAHSQQVSGICYQDDKLVITGSWDHSIKLWDIERQNCLMTINTSHVVTCLDNSSLNPHIVATGHPNGHVRTWNVRISDTDDEQQQQQAPFQPSHKGVVAALRWSDTSPYHLATASHDGSVKIWDVRSPIPLYTIHALEKRALALGQDEGSIYVGGVDKTIKQVAWKV